MSSLMTCHICKNASNSKFNTRHAKRPHYFNNAGCMIMESCPSITEVPQQLRVKHLKDIGHCPKSLSKADCCPHRLCSIGIDERLCCPSDTCPYRRSICPTPLEHMSITEIRRYRELNRDCSPLEKPSKVRPNKGDPSSKHPDEEPEATKNSNSHHGMDLTYIKEKRERLQNVLKQKHEKAWINWIDEGQDYQTDIAHDSCPNNNADSALTETQDHRGKGVCGSISEAEEDSKNIKSSLEHQVSTLQL